MEKKERRGRTKNVETWKQTMRKTLRQGGKEYLSTNGVYKRERCVQPGCGPTCHLKCTTKFNDDQRQYIHSSFWQLSDEQKNAFYWKYTARKEPKRRRDATKVSERVNTFCYYFERRSNEMLRVCRLFFLATLDITYRRIYYFYKHSFKPGGCVPSESKRGKNVKRSVPDLEKKLAIVREHISSFPAAKDGRGQERYLPAHLSVQRMYTLYTETTDESMLLKKHWYRRVFKQEFRLSFRKAAPKKPAVSVASVGVQASDSDILCIDNIIEVVPDGYSDDEVSCTSFADTID